jgi:DNA-binding transcriptional regulator YiaG
MTPDARQYNPDVSYLVELIDSLPYTQPELAARLGVTTRCLRQWRSGARQFPYVAQFALECLVFSK